MPHQSPCWESKPKGCQPAAGGCTAASSPQPQHPKNNYERSGGCFPLAHSKWVSCTWGRVRMVLWVQPLHQRGHPLPPGSLGHMSSAWHHSLGALRGRSIWRTGTSYKKQIKFFLCLSYLNYQWDSGTAQTNIQ